MGYTTEFSGGWTVTPPLKPEHLAYLKQFAEIRHMRRDADKAELLPDPLRLAVGLPIGFEGAYYVGTADKIASQSSSAPSVLDGNEPPGCPPMPPPKNPANTMGDFSTRYTTQLQLKAHAQALGLCVPGLWNQWVPNNEGDEISWDGGGKFYEYVEWIEYLLTHFLIPWGYVLNGEVYWDGEGSDDRGVIAITNNEVRVKHGHIVYR